MNTPDITCAILCYNYGRYLSQAIESCFSQNFDPTRFEVLVIDDGSTDETPTVCAGYGDRIRVSRSENLGFASSLSRALLEARGRYVSYLDADDWWTPDKLARVWPSLDRGALLVMHTMQVVDANGKAQGEIGALGNTSSLTVDRAAALTLLPAVTELFCHPLADLGHGVKLHEPLAYYRIHVQSMTDRSGRGKQTALMVRTNHSVAERLAALALSPPLWEPNVGKLRRLSLTYRAEALTKEFELATELRQRSHFVGRCARMLHAWLQSRRLPERRHARLAGRALLQIAGVK